MYLRLFTGCAAVFFVLTNNVLADYKNDMFRKILIAVAVTMGVLAGTSPDAFSLQTRTGSSSASSLIPQEQRVCSLLQQDLDRGAGIRAIVKTSIQMGYNACMVVKCALSSGGDPKEVIGGAIDAGTPSAVVARCSLDAGADAGEVLADLRNAGTNACYAQPLGYSEYKTTPPEPFSPPPPFPPVNQRVISPYVP
jgi:hypothetical protein